MLRRVYWWRWAEGSGGQNTAAGPAKALPFVSTIFGDDMVLQRGKLNTIWGWSDVGDTVRVQIGETTASGTAGADHRWQVKIQPPAAGGPYTVKISGHQTVELHDVLVGDVWLCGGQSNMSLPLGVVKNGEAEVKAADFPKIRFFEVAAHPAYHRTETVEGAWKAVTPETAARVSAVAYYFARRVQQDIHVPIGLVVDALGGTPAEAWTSAAALAPLKDFEVPLSEVKRLASANAPEYGNYIMHWYDEYDVGQKEDWAGAKFDDRSWRTVNVPGGFAELGVPDDPAVVWFRKEITLPDSLPSGKTAISLGSIQRMDTVYINGTSVGASAWVGEPAQLSHSRRNIEAGAECYRNPGIEDRAAWRLSEQAGGPSSDAWGWYSSTAGGSVEGQAERGCEAASCAADRL